MNIETAAPFYPLTETNHAGWVVIASLVFLVYALLGLVAKIVLRFNITSLKYYDLLLVFATVLFILQTICILLAADSGLGQHLNTLSETALVRYNKVFRHQPPIGQYL